MTWTPDAGLWAAPSRESGAAWCERTHRLSQGARPGPLRWDPHQREIVEALTCAGPPNEVWMMASAQGSGKSTIVRGALSYWLAEWRAPVLYVLPDETSAADVMQGDVDALIDDNEALRALRPANKRAVQRLGARFTNGARVRMAWAGSAARIAQHPARCGFAEEIDKWPRHVASGEDPMALMLARYKTFEPRHKHVGVCTPTLPDGRIAQAWDGTLDRREWAVPCVGCGLRFTASWDNVVWPGGDPHDHPSDPEARVALAAALLAEPDGVTVTCAHCPRKIETRELRAAARGGLWVPAPGARPDEIGAHLSRAYHLSDLATMPLARTAATYLRAITPAKRQEFQNQSLGLPWADATGEVPEWLIRKRARQAEGELPTWATAVLVTADTQVDHWWWSARAWGPDQRSRGLAWGRADTWAELVEITKRTWRGPGGERRASGLGVDVRGGLFGGQAGGQRTDQVYALVRETPGAVAILGEDRRDVAAPEPWIWSVSHHARTLRVHVHYWRDVVARLVAAEDPELWEEPVSAARDTYRRQVCSEVRVTETTNHGERQVWRLRADGRDNHLWDAVVYGAALADALGASRRVIVEDEAPPPRREQGKWRVGR